MTAGAAARSERRARVDEGLAGWGFSLPAVVLLAFFLAVPFGLAVWMSFTNQRLVSPLPVEWVGLENYRRAFEDPVFRRALVNNAVFVLVVVPLQTGLALFLAVLVNQQLRGTTFFRAVYFAPVATVMAAVAVVWRLLYEPDTGMINGFLGLVSFGQLEPAWLESTKTALLAIIILSIWQGVGFQMIVLLAGLQGIPQSLYDAAAVDGAGSWRQFRDITLPQLRNALIFVATVTTILAFRLFDQVWVLTRGGPLDATQTMMLRLVDVGFGEQRIGQASAIAVIFFVIVLAVTIIQRILVKEEAQVR
jgi:multiple sugar transport system permease protein